MENIFIIGSKGIPANYGGFETFVEELTKNKIDTEIKYHVSCLSNKRDEFIYNNSRCFNVKVPNIGPAKAIYYDIASLRESIKYIEKNNIVQAKIYILACRIGPFMSIYKKKLKKMGVELYVNPDGHEWKRAKWNFFIKKYWKLSERLMVKNSDVIICDSINIRKYIEDTYIKYKPKTMFIPYGAKIIDDEKVLLQHKKLEEWYKNNNIKENNYYLVVGRFVPENNYELMIREFMKSKTKKDFVIITNVEKNAFYEKLKNITGFEKDSRIKFVGTVYDSELLSLIRKNAFAYLHGHEVGGTNPSLLEALATTKLNLLLNVGFNEEVAKESALYFNKNNGSLAELINKCDCMEENRIEELSKLAKARITEDYTWENVVARYEEFFRRGR